MKKKSKCRELVIPLKGNRTFLAMKYLIILLVAFNLNGFSVVKAQQIAEYEVENANLKACIKKVEQLTGKGFLYNGNELERVGRVTLHLKDVGLDDLLTRILQGSGYTYELVNGVIAIVRMKDVPQREVEQERLKGRVLDAYGNALPGVTVLIKGTNMGVVTDTAGRFTLAVPKEREIVLAFSFVGMEKQEIKIVDFQREINVVMREKAGELEEVVITGYGETTKRKAAGSVAVLTKDAFENKIPISVDDILQGLVAGVAVKATSGRPGESSKIRIRGINTIQGDAEPLWVIDGVPLQDDLPEIDTDQIKSGNLNQIFVNGVAGINPSDIENVTILKDAAAAAIYGSRAAGGVIVVTTKQGRPGKMRVNYSMSLTMGLKPQRDANLMNSREKLAWEQELWDEFSADAFAASAPHVAVVGITGMVRANKLGRDGKLWTDEGFEAMSAAEQEAYLNDLASHSTDWFDELFRNSFEMNHHLSLSGGDQKYTYYFSMGYASQEGLVRKTDYDRYNLNLKLHMMPSPKITIDATVKVSRLVSGSYSGSVDPFSYAYFANPYERPYNEDGSYRADMTYQNLSAINDGNISTDLLPSNGFNVLREIDETSGKNDKMTTSGSLNLRYNITSKLAVSGLVSYSYDHNKSEDVIGKDTYTAFTDRLYFDRTNENWTPYGSITQTASSGDSYDARAQVSYMDTFWDTHTISLLGGAELRGNKSKRFYTKRYGYDPDTGNFSTPVNPDPDGSDASSYANLMDDLSGQSIKENTYASFYASLDYTFLDRYILNAAFRTDGSNNFGSKEQFNPTWSLGVAWHLDQENFMAALQPYISRLTLRVAGGYTGNVVQGVYKQLVIKYGSSYWNGEKTGSIDKAPNPRLRWEKTRDMKVALDFGLFGDRVSGLVEGYYRKSFDIISNSALSSTTGFKSIVYNASDIVNKGIEGTLRVAALKTRDFGIDVGANVAWNYNKLARFRTSNGATLVDGRFEGYPQDGIYGGKLLGIDPWTGLYLYKLRPDADIKETSDLNEVKNYRYYIGTQNAPVTGGFNVQFMYKNLRLNVGASYACGGKTSSLMDSPASYDKVAWYGNETPQSAYSDLYRNHLNVNKNVTNRWTQERTTGVKYPRIVDYLGESLSLGTYNAMYASIVNGAFYESNSYLRIRDITLSYNLPKSMLQRMGLSSLMMYFTMNNFFTFTGYSGIDPETPGATYPVTRSMSFGLSVGF